MKRLFDGRDFDHRGSSIDIDDATIELSHTPVDHYKEDAFQVHRDGDVLVVAYLVQDDSCENPMTSCDGEGRLIHSERHYDGYDPQEIEQRLGWDRDNDRPDPNTQVFVDGVEYNLWQLACKRVASLLDSDPELTLRRFIEADQFDALLADAGDVDLLFDDLADEIRERMEDPYSTDHSDEIEEEMKKLYVEHWRQIVSPFVVEANYEPDRYHRTASVSLFRGDAEDVKALWIGDEDEQENIACNAPEFTDELELDEWLRGEAMKYADGVLKVFNEWAEGDCYGVVVETFKRQLIGVNAYGWAQVNEDSCWGFVGSSSTIEVMEQEYLKYALDHALERCIKHGADPAQATLF